MYKLTTNRGKPGLLFNGFKYRIKNMDVYKKDSTTDLSDLIILDGRFDHNHAEI